MLLLLLLLCQQRRGDASAAAAAAAAAAALLPSIHCGLAEATLYAEATEAARKVFFRFRTSRGSEKRFF
jgi:hypothetical protein